MDADQIAAIAGPALIIAGIVVLAFVALRPPPRPASAPVELQLADPDTDDDDFTPGLDDGPSRRLPAGAERVLAGLTEVTPDPRNQRVITTTHRDASSVATPMGDPDTGVIRVLDRSQVQQHVPEHAVGRHPASPRPT